jgi:pyridoxal phosphate enzyme (YggS family)
LMADNIADRVSRVVERVGGAAQRSGRDPATVRVVAVTKGVALDAVEQAVAAGVTDLGENRAEELSERAGRLPGSIRWHFVGSLQSRKVRHLTRVLLVHSLDRDSEAKALHKHGERSDRSFDVLIQVNVAREPQKQGIMPGEIDDMLGKLSLYPQVKPRGFMFMAPMAENAEDVRWVFAEGKQLAERYSSYGLDELSMGMSDDYEVAVEEGATIVRIGRAIFASEEN